MALTLTPIAHAYSIGSNFEITWKAAGDKAYPTGGYPLSHRDLGIDPAKDPEFYVEVDNLMGYGAAYDYTNELLLIYDSAGAEVGSGQGSTDLSGLTDMRIRVTGKFRA